MILAFDLDDTLYPEREYVLSGFRAVAGALEERFGASAERSLELMLESLERHGRGRQLDDVLRAFDLHSPARVRWLLGVYRLHEPALALPTTSCETLTRLADAGHALYLVTDGHKLVQAKKLAALGAARYFRHCYLTSRYGRRAAKPSTRVFELMLERERASPGDLAYIGDDPSKDFVGVSALGGRTVRVLTGRLARVQARRGYDAEVSIAGLAELPALVESWASH